MKTTLSFSAEENVNVVRHFVAERVHVKWKQCGYYKNKLN